MSANVYKLNTLQSFDGMEAVSNTLLDKQTTKQDPHRVKKAEANGL